MHDMCTHAQVYTHAYTHTHTLTNIHVLVYTHTHIHTHTHPCSDLEDQWQGKSALPLLGNRLQLPVSGACLFSLRGSSNCRETEREREGEREGEGEGESREIFAAISVSTLLNFM